MCRYYGLNWIGHLAVGNIFHAKENQKNKGNPPLSPHSSVGKACQKRKETSSLRKAETRVFLLLCKGEGALDARSPLLLDYVVRIHAYPQFLGILLDDTKRKTHGE